MALAFATANYTDTAVSGLATNPLALRVLNTDVDWVMITDTPDRKVYKNQTGPITFQDTIIVTFREIKNMYSNIPDFPSAFKSIYTKGLAVRWQYNGYKPETDTVDTAHLAYVPYVEIHERRMPMHPNWSAAICLETEKTLAALPFAKGIAATSGQVFVNLLNGVRKY